MLFPLPAQTINYVVLCSETKHPAENLGKDFSARHHQLYRQKTTVSMLASTSTTTNWTIGDVCKVFAFFFQIVSLLVLDQNLSSSSSNVLQKIREMGRINHVPQRAIDYCCQNPSQQSCNNIGLHY